MRRALALAGTTAVFAGVIGASSAAAADPWGWEQVTPTVKGAGTVSYVDTFRPSPDGNAFLYTANSQFSSLPGESQPAYTRYIGRRGADAWGNRPLDPPYVAAGLDDSGAAFNIMGVVRSSYGLDHVMVASAVAKAPGAIEGGGNLYLRDTRTGAYTLIAAHENRFFAQWFTTTLGSSGTTWVAPDGKGAIFTTALSLVPGAPENADIPWKGGATYGWTPEGGLEALTVLPASEGGQIVEATSTASGNETGPRESQPRHNALDHFYFGSRVGDSVGGVYERTGDESYPVSYSRITGDKSNVIPAYAVAVSDNGEHLMIETTQATKLTSDTPDVEGIVVKYLYRYNQSDKSLEYVGTNDGYVGVLQMTQDGQTVAFQSSAKLTDDAIQGEPNIYVWRDGETQLVATPEATSSGFQTSFSLRVLSENGRYFSFTDNSARLANQFDQENISEDCPAPFFGGPGPCDQVFLFDADATGEQLQCISCRPDGAAPKGDSGDPVTGNSGYIRMDEHQMQTVANDGTTFFTTKDGLLPEDGNELEDVYAYKDGDLRLVSRANMGTASRFLDATYDGKSVFIGTDDPIVQSDTDRAYDVYLTRQGAGFPFNPVIPIPPCDGLEACRGASPAAPGSSPSGSEFFHGRSNPSTAPGTVKLSKMRTSGPVATLSLKVSGKGKLTASGKGLKKSSKATKKPAVYKLKVKLDGKAQKALKKKGTLKKKVKVTFKPSEGRASSVTRTLTFKAPSTGKGGK